MHPIITTDPTPEQFAEWRRTHPPIMGGSAPGADGGGAGGAGTGGGAPATAAQPAGAQPGDQGRGDVDHLAGLYDLSSAPEGLRPFLQEELRKINAGVGRRFQEHADFRQQYEPLAGIEGLTDTPPEDLQDLLAIHSMIVEAADEQSPNDERLYQWWEQLGEHFGFHGDGTPAGDSGEGGEPAGSEEEPPAWARQIMEENRELRERLDGTERSTAVQQAEQQVQREMTELAEKHSLDEAAQASVYQLAYAYNGAPDALQKGLADFFRISGKAESELLDGGGEARPGPTTPAGGQVPAAAGGDGPMRLGDRRLRSAAVARLQGQSTGAAA